MHLTLAVAAVLLPCAVGHGQMNFPPSRIQSSLNTGSTCTGDEPEKSPQSGVCLWFSNGCQPGCSECGGADCGQGPCCKTLMKPTLIDPQLRTYNNTAGFDWTAHNPWRSPGFAPIYSPCGLAGGGYTPYLPGGGIPPPGVKQGFDGRDLPELSGIKTVWPQGSAQDVAWSISANHGGGYSYRLCPKSANMTEECFQSHHLQFVGDQSWIQYGDDESNRTAIPATRVSVGTNPPGSQWTKNPIPACSGPAGGAQKAPGCDKPMFPAPLTDVIPPEPRFGVDSPGLYGACAGRCAAYGPYGNCTAEEEAYWTRRCKFNIIDKVLVPGNLPIGDYLLSFRWDCEQTLQIWSECSDVTITAQNVIV